MENLSFFAVIEKRGESLFLHTTHGKIEHLKGSTKCHKGAISKSDCFEGYQSAVQSIKSQDFEGVVYILPQTKVHAPGKLTYSEILRRAEKQ